MTLLNARRLKEGKSTLGFINPLLYANPDAFTDITIGDSSCSEQEFCCPKAYYSAQTGWDPVSGLGTPNYVRLAEVIDLLP